MKRVADILFSLMILTLTAPAVLLAMLLIWLQDFHSPFYIATRIGQGMKPFAMIKLRTMVLGADRSGIESTAKDDGRITRIGHFVRKFKLDELPQFWNVLRGEMSIVGPRPNTEKEVAPYTEEEGHLLQMRPGVTDFASIVFADEGDILAGAQDPDLLYHQIIRPYKSRLGLLYVRRHTLWIDARLVILTGVAMISRRTALRHLRGVLREAGAEEMLVEVAKRNGKLRPLPPPGALEVVRSRAHAARRSV